MIQVYGATDIKDTYDGDRREPWDRASSRWDNLHVVSDTVCCSVEREWLQQQSLLLVQCGGHTLHHAGRVCRLQPNGLDDMLVIYADPLLSSCATTFLWPGLCSGAQYAWLKADLGRIDRQATPWVVASWHPPWYNSYASHYQEFECMRLQMEELLYRHRVDIVFSGHVCLA